MYAPEDALMRSRKSALGASRATDTRPGGEVTHEKAASVASCPVSKPEDKQRNGEVEGVCVGVDVPDAVDVADMVPDDVSVGVAVIDAVIDDDGVMLGVGFEHAMRCTMLFEKSVT